MDAIGGVLLIGTSFAAMELVIRRKLVLSAPVGRLWMRLRLYWIPRQNARGDSFWKGNVGRTPDDRPTSLEASNRVISAPDTVAPQFSLRAWSIFHLMTFIRFRVQKLSLPAVVWRWKPQLLES